jgi:hypothetical protein
MFHRHTVIVWLIDRMKEGWQLALGQARAVIASFSRWHALWLE